MEIFTRTWSVNAPWAHPLWQQYAILLYDLTTPHGDDPAVLYRPDVTHEVMLFSMDPEIRVEEHLKPITEKLGWPVRAEDGVRGKLLQPANFAYQFTAPSHEAAEDRIQRLVDRIAARDLNPDTDNSSGWDVIFKDGVTLKKSIFSDAVKGRVN